MSQSTTIPSSTDTPTLHVHQMETAICACDATIPGDMIDRRLISTAAWRPTRERMTAYCVHCQSVWQVDRELRAGVWVMRSGPARLAAKAAQDAIKRFDERLAIQRTTHNTRTDR